MTMMHCPPFLQMMRIVTVYSPRVIVMTPTPPQPLLLRMVTVTPSLRQMTAMMGMLLSIPATKVVKTASITIVMGRWTAPDSACSSVDPVCWECGNNVVDPNEDCDDGNMTSGDGCSSSCEYESQQIYQVWG